jgi:hypothetical protein
MAEQATSRIDIDVRGGDSAERAAAALDRLVVSEGKAVSGSDALTASTDRQSKVRERSEAGLERLARRHDAEYRAVQQLIKDQRDLERAYEAGLGSTQAYAVALEALRQKRIQLGSAMNDNAPAAMTARLTDWARDANSMTGRLDLWSRTQKSATQDVESHTKAVGLQRYELINLSRQFQDIGVSLAGGQAPLTVLIQQGSQIADVFGSSNAGAGAALKSFGQTVLRFALNPITLLTAGFGAAALAAYQFSQQQAALERSLNGVGRLSGASASGLRQMAADASRAPGGPSYGQAVSGAAEFASVGISAQNIPTLLADMTRFSHAFGVDMDAAQKEIAQIVGESGLGAFERRFGPVSFATKEMVRSLEASGQFAEAAALKTRMFDEETQKAKDSASELQRIWESVAKWATTPIFGLGSTINRAMNGPSLQEQLAQARGEYFNLRAQRRGDQSAYPGETAAEQRVRELERRVQEERDRPAREARNLELNRLSDIAGRAVDSTRPDLAQLRGLTESRDALQKLLGSDDGLAKLGDRADEARDALSALNDQIEAWKSTTDRMREDSALQIREIMARTYAERESVAMERAKTQALREGKTALQASIAVESERARLAAESAKRVEDLVRSSRDQLQMAGMTDYERGRQQILNEARDFKRENIPNAATPMNAAFDTAAIAARNVANAFDGLAARIGAPGAAASNVVNFTPRGNMTPADPRGLSSYIQERAAAYGIDPRTALRVARSEGLASFYGDYVNGRPTSFGALQLHVGGGVGDEFRRATGLDPSNPANEKQTIDFALRIAAQRGWGPWHGAARVGVGQWEGIGSSPRVAGNDNTLSQRTDNAVADKLKAYDVERIDNRIRDVNTGLADQNRLLVAQRSALDSDSATLAGVIEAQKLLNFFTTQRIAIDDRLKQKILEVGEAERKRVLQEEEDARALRNRREELDIARSGVSGSMSGALRAMANGENVGEALNQALTGVRDRIFDMVSSRFSEALLGPMASTNGGALGNIFGFGQSQNVAQMTVSAGNVVVMGGAAGLPGVGGAGGGFLGGIFDKIGSFFNSIGQNADGTDSWRGGLTWVGERGPELLNLPRGSQIMSNEQSVSFARDQAVAARSHTAAMAVVAAQPSAPAGQPGNVYVSIEKAPANARVEHSTDSKGNRRVRVVFDEAVASSLHSPHGRSAMAAMGVKPRLARM